MSTTADDSSQVPAQRLQTRTARTLAVSPRARAIEACETRDRAAARLAEASQTARADTFAVGQPREHELAIGDDLVAEQPPARDLEIVAARRYDPHMQIAEDRVASEQLVVGETEVDGDEAVGSARRADELVQRRPLGLRVGASELLDRRVVDAGTREGCELFVGCVTLDGLGGRVRGACGRSDRSRPRPAARR